MHDTVKGTALGLLLIFLCVSGVAQPYPYPANPNPAPSIIGLEFFFDNDPGFGNGNFVTVTPATDISSLVSVVDISSLTPGVHRLYIRTLSADFQWSLTSYSIFENLEPAYPSSPAAAQFLSALEYFFDTDPGFGLGTAVSLTPASEINGLSQSINLPSAMPGAHRLFIRSRDLSGKWSFTSTNSFNNADYIYPVTPSPAGSVVALEYFFDSDPGFGNGTSLSFTPGVDISSLIFMADISGLADGAPHVLFIRSLSSGWGLTEAAGFTIDSILPVKLVSFSGAYSDGEVKLYWNTATELSNSHFDVERSAPHNPSDFAKIGEVAGNGTTHIEHEYEFTDTSPGDDLQYYRLKQVDYDGIYEYSPIIIVYTIGREHSISLRPNPASDHLTIDWSDSSSDENVPSITVTDLMGRTLHVPFNRSGFNQITFDVKGVKSGMYLLHAQLGNWRKIIRFIIVTN